MLEICVEFNSLLQFPFPLIVYAFELRHNSIMDLINCNLDAVTSNYNSLNRSIIDGSWFRYSPFRKEKKMVVVTSTSNNLECMDHIFPGHTKNRWLYFYGSYLIMVYG
jgi:hypothetical protein